MFFGGDLSAVRIEPLYQVTDGWKQTDYHRINLLIEFFRTHFKIDAAHLPDEVTHFRNLLENPLGRELFIKNHFALWDSKLRKNFIYQLDDMCEQPMLRTFIENQCNLVEFSEFNPDGAENSIFNYEHYVPNNGPVNHTLPFCSADRSFCAVFRVMRNVYHHCKYFDGRHFHTQALDKLLHSTFPFAIEQLCIHFSEIGFIHRFWEGNRK
ncbi:hypothetical protein AQUCO_02500328v1 [Aquilegia coerulea]|uniref:Uncharacterized protein n=1 Tax=Aquilegia coerulea TaxID=218851 RepID=A0A2G5DAQ1_AQUCA|nr:hypothetical protein AQUCO_02500328v1 [Aquilegia coerulea]